MGVFQACEKPDCGCAPPLSSELMGQWQWVKTVTPTRVITPQSAGFKRLFEHENDGTTGDYIAFYRNDSLYYFDRPVRTFYQEDRRLQTVLAQYGDRYLKYYLKTSSTPREMEMSELMPVYNEKADTIRHYYRYIGRSR